MAGRCQIMFTLQTMGRNADFTLGAWGICWRVSGAGREHDQVYDFRESLWLLCGKQSADTRVRDEEPVTWLVVEERRSLWQSRQRWRWSAVVRLRIYFGGAVVSIN